MAIIREALRAVARRAKPLEARLRRSDLLLPVSDMARRLYRLYLVTESMTAAERAYCEGFNEIPIEPGLVLLESYWGRKVACGPYAIFRALERRADADRFSYVWCKDENIDIPEDVARHPRVSFVSHRSVDYSLALLRARFLVSNSTFPPYFVRREGQAYLNTWHGVPIKHMGRDADPTLLAASNVQRNFIHATHLLFGGDHMWRSLVKPYGMTAMIGDRLHAIGTPRVDLILNADRAEVRRRLGVGDDVKVVLFAPTWRGRMREIETDISRQVEAIKRLNASLGSGYKVLLSVHQLIRERMVRLGRSIDVVPKDIDINELMAGVDVLVSDYSSIMVDFLPLDRPIVSYAFDKAEYEATRGLYLRIEDLPVALATDLDGLIAAVRAERLPSSFPTFEPTRELLLAGEDGAASDRAAALIADAAPAVDPAPPVRRKKRILIYGGGFLPNGITASLLNLLDNIDYDGNDVFLVVDSTTIDNDPLRSERYGRVNPRCQVIWRNGKLMLSAEEAAAFRLLRDMDECGAREIAIVKSAFAREARRTFGDEEFDVAIDFSGYSPFWATVIAAANARKCVIYQHNHLWAEANNPHPDRDQTQLKGVFRCYRFYDTIVSVSAETMRVNQNHLQDYYGEAHAATVRNPIAIADLVAKSKQEPQLGDAERAKLERYPDAVRFISLGRFSPEKNHARLLRAFAAVLQEKVDAVLMIVGDGPLREATEKLAGKLDIAHRVVFTGRLTNPFPLLKSSDCLVLSSDYEGQPMTILEALALGVPCIGTDIPGNRSLLGHGYGTLVDADAESLALGMIDFVREREPGLPFDPHAYQDEVMAEFAEIVCAPLPTPRQPWDLKPPPDETSDVPADSDKAPSTETAGERLAAG